MPNTYITPQSMAEEVDRKCKAQGVPHPPIEVTRALIAAMMGVVDYAATEATAVRKDTMLDDTQPLPPAAPLWHPNTPSADHAAAIDARFEALETRIKILEDAAGSNGHLWPPPAEVDHEAIASSITEDNLLANSTDTGNNQDN